MRISNFYVVVMLVFSISCIEEYNPKISDYMNALVVEGEITNEQGPYLIKLSESADVNSPKLIPASNAQIIITDDFGSSETLNEIEPGIYSTDILGLQGVVGRQYKINVNYNGKMYESDFTKLEAPVEIDSIYARVQYVGRFEGLQFYINTRKQAESKYFSWKLAETYKFEADDYPLDFIYINEDSIVVPDPDAIHVCWQTKNLFDIYTAKTANLNEHELRGFQLNYVDTETKKLSIRYSLLVKQYSISKEAYNYMTEIKEQNDESGSLYSTQPYLLNGNVYNIEDRSEPVLGYFMVAGVSQRRIFVDKPSLNFYLDLCKATADSYMRWANSRPPRSYPIFVKLVDGELGRAGIGCFDCRMEGGTTQKPDFWID